MIKSCIIRIKGIVQGVGFRPFIFKIAADNKISGVVINDTEGVEIEAEAEEINLNSFIDDIRKKAPPLAHIYSIETNDQPVKSFTGFTIGKSRITSVKNAFYSPDVALCEDCKKEFFDESDRRFHYPFITCINCGPRFSIVTEIPYDRPNTSMNIFPMCGKCEAEYYSHSDRRFHAQPNACPSCGPSMMLTDKNGIVIESDNGKIASKAVEFLKNGKILAIKGIGGYHIACDAKNDTAVKTLRERKKRPVKPFALMAADIKSVSDTASVSAEEIELLESKERPIVLLDVIKSNLSSYIAPGLSSLGFMVPYTPFQHLIFSIDPEMVLVMTSGNISDEPIVYRDNEAYRRLKNIADYFITYNREIVAQSDDSVMFVESGMPFFIRRSRGFVPVPFKSKKTEKKILAMGGDMKNSFAIAANDFLILSQYLGDMEDMQTHEEFRNSVRHLVKIFDAEPDIIVSDMHPGYMTTIFADELSSGKKKRIKVQHHHAHIASVLEEHGLEEKVIGIAFDGTGFGTDGTLWGSEFLICDRKEFRRKAHFSPFPLPGGESAIKDVWKIGLSLLHTAYGENIPFAFGPEQNSVIEIINKKTNSPLTCSIGRIFDGVSSILGISNYATAEAEAAIMLEEMAKRSIKSISDFIIPFSGGSEIIISTPDLIRHIADLKIKNNNLHDISHAFHKSIAETSVKVAEKIRNESGINKLVLSGGVFQNRIILRMMIKLLQSAGFNILLHQKTPFNDGCIAVGQISVAKELIK